MARLTPVPGVDVDDVLGLSLGLDVWERNDEALLVAADEKQLSELERRRIAEVEYVSAIGSATSRAEEDDESDGGGP